MYGGSCPPKSYAENHINIVQLKGNMKMNRLRPLLTVCFCLLCSAAVADEKQKEPFYAQLSRAIIRLEHTETLRQEGSTTVIQRNVPDGTAFFIASSNGLYVVSARHVVQKPYDLHARVQCKNQKTGKLEVILLELPRDKWTYHTNNGDKDTRYVDVAVMKIPNPRMKDRSVKHFRYESKGSKDHHKNQLSFEDPEPPSPVLVFGFPADVGFQLREQRPFGRLGIISMRTGKEFLKIDGKKFAEERCRLIDASMFSGNSGSPVMNQPRFGDKKPKLLGLVIASNNALDFGVIEPVSRIRETLDLAKDKPASGNWKSIQRKKKAEPKNSPHKK